MPAGDRSDAAFAALHGHCLPLPEEGDGLGLGGERVFAPARLSFNDRERNMTSFKNLALLIGAFVACTSLPALARGGGGGGGGAGSAGSASSAPSAATAHQSTGITSTNPAQPGTVMRRNPALTSQPGTTATSPAQPGTTAQPSTAGAPEIGRASCRERVYVLV